MPSFFKKSSKSAEAADSTTTAPATTAPAHKQVQEVTANDTDSQMTQVAGSEAGPADDSAPRRKSWFHKSKKDHADDKDGDRKKSISDSGPYIFAFDPVSGKEVLQKNPHWPNEDSWKREDKNGWAMGSMFGNQKSDFGGTTG